jgi:hypothetical protein
VFLQVASRLESKCFKNWLGGLRVPAGRRSVPPRGETWGQEGGRASRLALPIASHTGPSPVDGGLRLSRCALRRS